MADAGTQATESRRIGADQRSTSCCSMPRCWSQRPAIPRCSRSCRRSGARSGIADFWVAIAYTWSAVLWVWLAPTWAEKSDHHGRKALTLLGLAGFIVSMSLCGLVLIAGLHGWIGVTLTFLLFGLFRGIYGALGCATPSATQAYLAAKTRRSARTAQLSALSSSFGLGTIVGPALAPSVRAAVHRPAGTAVRLCADRDRGVRRHPVVAARRSRPAAAKGAARR